MHCVFIFWLRLQSEAAWASSPKPPSFLKELLIRFLHLRRVLDHLHAWLACQAELFCVQRSLHKTSSYGDFSCRNRRTRQEAYLGSRNQRRRVWWRFGSSIYPRLQLGIDHLETMVLHLLIVVLFTNLMPFRKKWTGFPNELYQELLQPKAQLFQFSSKTWQ